MCGNPKCEAPFKHPVAANWQHTPHWSEEQVEAMEALGQLDTGYGVLLDGQLLVVDIDERNGGHTEHMGDLLMGCEFIVKTGSGGESRHYYFKCPPDTALQHHLEDYKGVDFKSSGFVVGPGSMHASGNRYEVIFGKVENIDVAPDSLIELLKKPEHFRATVNGSSMDVDVQEIAEMLACIDPDIEYEDWFRIGMAIHHTTGGTGLDIWDDWSSKGSKYKKGECEKRWHSFGKSSAVCTLGTLMHHAQLGGYVQSVEFECTDTFDYVEEREDGLPFSIDGVDLLRPSGFVGELTQWINSQCRYPREHLAVSAALVSIGNITGLRYTDDINNVTANLFAFCVAGSSSGKNDVLSAVKKIHAAAGIQSACHGAIKSEQEIIRNLIRHQASFYIYDELGEALQKIVNSKKAGGAAYLQGVIGMLMCPSTASCRRSCRSGS
ncbi:MAG: PriCT-2 domain-containing protein, partial [Nitrosomonadaceae bacterium]